jgi:hypoxanthine phosphoribosyltransferase
MLKLSWNKITKICKKLAETIFTSYIPEVIVGIAKGGLIPAALMGKYFHTCSNIISIQVTSYPEWMYGASVSSLRKKRRDPVVLNAPETKSFNRRQALLIDDIVDSGFTMRLAKTYLSFFGAAEVKTASIVFKPNPVFTPDFFGMKQNNNKWIIFPWEIDS